MKNSVNMHFMNIQDYPMRAKRLEAILGSELNVGEAEMVTRFQKLRDNRLLPTSRGRNAEDINIDGVVAGILSIVPARPGWAGQQAVAMKGLLPVGTRDRAFAQAGTFAEALKAGLSDAALLNTILEIRMTESEVFKNSFARGAIFFKEGDGERVTYYVHQNAVSLLQPGMEDKYNPRDGMASIIHETIVLPRILKRIMAQYRDAEQHAALMSRPWPDGTARSN